jgi:DNA-binding CsgD family transcriptional regulator
MKHAILALNLAAFISGAAAMAFLLVLARQRPSPIVMISRRALVALTFIAACNGVDYYLGAFAWIHDPRLSFMTMNFLALATLYALSCLFRIIEEITSRPLGGAFWNLFRAQSFLAYAATLAAVLFAGSAINPSAGYAVSALDAAACILAAAVVACVRFRLIPARDRPFAASLVGLALLWLVLDVGNELAWWRDLFGIPQIALSPVFLVALSICAIARAARLLSADTAIPGKAETVDIGVPILTAQARAVMPAARWDLSEREREVFALLVAGYENAEISARLFISPHTVKNHVSNVYRKAGVRNRLELMRIAVPTGEESLPGK